MSYDQYAIVLVLLDRFTHILKDTAAANNATIRARAALFGREKTLPEFEAYVLNRVVELADDEAEGRPLMLHEAVRNAGDLSTAIETDASTIDDLDMAGFTALHLACLYDNFDALKFLIRNRAKVHTTDRQGDTPLHLAASRGQVAFAACLLDAGSDINQRGLNGETPLHKACRSVILDDDSQIVEYLLGRGAAASACNNYGESVLHLLANQPRSSQAVRRRADVLMQFGAWAMVDTQNHFGNTPLLKAIWEVNDTMVPLLLAAGARCDLSNSKRLNVLHAAGRIGNRTIINCLRKAELSGPDFRSKTTDGLTPIGELRRAIYRDRHMVSEMVKDRNPTPDEISAFEALLREVRNRGVIAEVAKLEDVIADIESMAVMKARESLKELTRSKREAGIEEEMKIIRKADLNVKQDSLQQAVQTLKEYIAVAKSRMKISPFEEEENPWVKLKEMEETNYKDGTKELSSDEDEYESCVE
ncbi:ankyrin repeat-containing domain protein [Hypoxylon crocopeplum]|nr:ankyrin repeat-containing domain protein [Hypoxylon crocopeplum]